MFRRPGTLAKRPSQLLKACWLSAVLRPAQAAASHRNCNPEWHVVQPLRPPKWRWLRASLIHRRTPATRAAGASGRAQTNPPPAVLAAKAALVATPIVNNMNFFPGTTLLRQAPETEGVSKS